MTSAAADPSLIDSPTAAWRLLTTLGLVTLGNSGMYVVSVVLPAVQTEFGVSRAAASMPYTLMMVGLGLGGIFTGRLADRHGIARVETAPGGKYAVTRLATGPLWQTNLAV